MKDKIEICEWIWTELNTALSQIVKSAISAIFKVDTLAQHTRLCFFYSRCLLVGQRSLQEQKLLLPKCYVFSFVTWCWFFEAP